MTGRTQFLATAMFVVAASACAPAAPPAVSAADKAAIQSAVDAALKIGNTQPLDVAAYVKAYYADNAILLPPNEKAVEGSAALVAWFKAFPPLSNVKFTLQEIEGVGDKAYVRGTYSLTATPPGAAAMTDSGKYLEIWQKQADGSWRSIRDEFNSDLPAAPPPPPAKKK